MKARVNLEVLANLKVSYDKKIDALRFLLKGNRNLISMLNSLRLDSSENRARELFQLIARLNKSNQVVTLASGADKLFRQMKISISPLANDFYGIIDEIASQFVRLDADRQKILHRIFYVIFRTAEGSALNYRIISHPQFLKTAGSDRP